MSGAGPRAPTKSEGSVPDVIRSHDYVLPSPAESAKAALARKEAAEVDQAAKARDLETALREAASLFKAEMAVKAAELDALHAELR